MSDPNRELFNRVILLLRPMLDDLVFVGGCATGLLITDVAAGGIRPTKDVDAIVDVGSYAQYAELSERLRAVGLVEDSREGAPMDSLSGFLNPDSASQARRPLLERRLRAIAEMTR